MRFLSSLAVSAALALVSCGPSSSMAVDQVLGHAIETGACNFEQPNNPRQGSAVCRLSLLYYDDAQISITRIEQGVPYMHMVTLDGSDQREMKFEDWFKERYRGTAAHESEIIGVGSGTPPPRS